MTRPAAAKMRGCRRPDPCRTHLRMVPGPDQPDSELVARCLARDETAAALLYRRHVRRIAGMMHRLAGPEAADDLVQEAFAEAFGSLHKLRDPDRFGGWLAVIAVRKARKQVGRLLRTPLQRVELVRSLAGPTVSDAVVDAYHQLTSLAPKVYVAWMLRRVEGFTIAQTAELCRVGTTTVKRWVARGDARVESLTRGSEQR